MITQELYNCLLTCYSMTLTVSKARIRKKKLPMPPIDCIIKGNDKHRPSVVEGLKSMFRWTTTNKYFKYKVYF